MVSNVVPPAATYSILDNDGDDMMAYEPKIHTYIQHSKKVSSTESTQERVDLYDFVY